MKRLLLITGTTLLVTGGLFWYLYPRPVWGNATTPTPLKPTSRTVTVNRVPVPCTVAWGAPSGPMRSAFGAGVFKARWLTLKEAAGMELPPARVVFEGVNVDDARDLNVAVPRAHWNQLGAVVRAVVPEVYSVQITSETRTMDVYILEARREQAPKLKTTTQGNGSFEHTKSYLRAKGATMGQLALALEGMIRIPVIDMTGLNEKYDVEMAFARADPTQLMKEFASKAGLQVRQEKQDVSVSIVRPLSHTGSRQAAAAR